jgi:hypothetical protein
MTVIRAVVFKESDMWVAQCLEYNIASCGDSKEELAENLLGQLSALFELRPAEPFADFRPAPSRFFQMFDEAVSQRKAESLRPRLGQRLWAFLSGRPRPQVLAAAVQ